MTKPVRALAALGFLTILPAFASGQDHSDNLLQWRAAPAAGETEAAPALEAEFAAAAEPEAPPARRRTRRAPRRPEPQAEPARASASTASRPAVTPVAAVVRGGPSERYPQLGTTEPGERVRITASSGAWTRVLRATGRAAWVRSADLSAPPPVAPAAGPRPQAPRPKSTPGGAFAGTRPDPLGTQASPTAAIGDSWRMLLCLLPVLGLVVLAVRGLKAFHRRNGALPSLRGILRGGLSLVQARATGGSSIRVVESVPIGTAALHLVEVRGRLLLLGAGSAGLALLRDMTDAEQEAADFQAVLSRAAQTPEPAEQSVAAVVGTVDGALRRTRETIERQAEALRRWRDTGADGAPGRARNTL